MPPINDIIVQILQASLTLLSVFFGLFTIFAALLIDTHSNLKQNTDERIRLQNEYEADTQWRDVIDPRRQNALKNISALSVMINHNRIRSKLLRSGMLLFEIFIALSSLIAIICFSNMVDSNQLNNIVILFYILLMSPIVSTIVIFIVVRAEQ